MSKENFDNVAIRSDFNKLKHRVEDLENILHGTALVKSLCRRIEELEDINIERDRKK